jgi:hypothetical protein
LRILRKKFILVTDMYRDFDFEYISRDGGAGNEGGGVDD